MNDAELDQVVQQALADLQASGESVGVESVARRIQRRTSDVLDAMRRLAGSRVDPPDLTLPPEQYPEVLAVAHKLAAIQRAYAEAEATLEARERVLTRADAQAAEALINGGEPINVQVTREAVQAAMESLRLLTLAEQTLKDRLATALATAQTQQQQAVWSRFQQLLAAHLVSTRALVATWEPLRAYCAAHDWRFGLTPFRGTMQTMEESWVPGIEALLAQDEAAAGGGVEVPVGMPRPY